MVRSGPLGLGIHLEISKLVLWYLIRLEGYRSQKLEAAHAFCQSIVPLAMLSSSYASRFL